MTWRSPRRSATLNPKQIPPLLYIQLGRHLLAHQGAHWIGQQIVAPYLSSLAVSWTAQFLSNPFMKNFSPLRVAHSSPEYTPAFYCCNSLRFLLWILISWGEREPGIKWYEIDFHHRLQFGAFAATSPTSVGNCSVFQQFCLILWTPGLLVSFQFLSLPS